MTLHASSKTIRDRVLSTTLSLATAILPGCVATRGESPEQPTVESPRERSIDSPLSLEFSSSLKNRYAASGFTLGDGPVAQNSLTATVEREGILEGAQFGVWTNLDIGGLAKDSDQAFHEVDLSASAPLLRGPVEVRVGGQYWRFEPHRGDAYIGEISASGRLPGVGIDLRGLVRHVLPFDGHASGELYEIGASRTFGLNDSGSISFDVAARAGLLDNFFGVNGSYVVPEAGVNLRLSDSMSLRASGGYQSVSGDGLSASPLAELTFTFKW